MKYLPSIGVEAHVQLKTKTKLFSAVSNDARGANPNSLISHIDVGLPGALPVLNTKAIEICVKAALALGTKPQKFSKFERKHYFYPDLPKGYQITQYEDPIIIGGSVEILVDGQAKKIRIERANLEEDAGKNTHPPGTDYSLVDLNRAGTPLLEIVSHPDIHSPAEAKAYARELYLLMKYAGVTDGDLYHGHMRFDLNISISSDKDKLGTRSEVKNLNSFRSVEAAVAYEIKRQSELLEKGENVVQETRGWDEAKQKTFGQRTKEESEDYRYMPEPDIPPIELDEQLVMRTKKDLPRLPAQWREILNKLSIRGQNAETLLDDDTSLNILNSYLSESRPADFIKIAANFLVNDHRMWVNKYKGSATTELTADNLFEAITMVQKGEITRQQLKGMWDSIEKGQSPKQHVTRKAPELYAKLSDEAMEKIVSDVIVQNPKVLAI